MAAGRIETKKAWLQPVDYHAAGSIHRVAKDGAYRRQIDACWLANGVLIDDDFRFGQITKIGILRWRKIKPVIAEFFQMTEDGWRRKRVSQELENARKTTEARRDGGLKTAQKRWDKEAAPAIAQLRKILAWLQREAEWAEERERARKVQAWQRELDAAEGT
jgi:uncharacterized protein YdaU (DUF1376 family)